MAAAVDALGNDALADVLPFLQPAVFDRATRQAVRKDDWNLKELRALAAERSGHEPPQLEQIRRVTWGSIGKIAVIAFLVYALASAFSTVSLSELVDELKGADLAWLIAALILTPIVQVPQAFSTIGATLHPVRFKPILMLQYGVQFIALAVPSSAARIALEIRFFERVGVPGAGALSISVIDSFSTFLLQVAMILVVTLSGLASLDWPSRGSGSSGGMIDWETVAIVAVVLVITVIVAFAVPRFRAVLHRFRGALREKASDGREALGVLRHPSKLVLLFGGNLAAQILLSIILGLCLRAFGHSATLAEMILVNTVVTLFAGFMPVPGGVGVAEAGYAAALVALGVPSAAATSTAIAYRLITFYLPPIWGALSMRWMRKHDYL